MQQRDVGVETLGGAGNHRVRLIFPLLARMTHGTATGINVTLSFKAYKVSKGSRLYRPVIRSVSWTPSISWNIQPGFPARCVQVCWPAPLCRCFARRRISGGIAIERRGFTATATNP